MRPIDELLADARHAAANGVRQLLINQQELRQLKDYEMVIGTENPNAARVAEPWGTMNLLPDDFRLLVVEVLP